MKQANWDRWQRIRNFYAMYESQIMKCASEWGCDPYSWEEYAGVRFTHIEMALWCDIRSENLVLYPQYPVGRFFVDFGNPVAKVAIECDGAAFHTDARKDANRDAELRAMGWKTFRIWGKDCITECEEKYDENGLPIVEISEALKFIRKIKREFPSIEVGSTRKSPGLLLWGVHQV